MAFSYQGKRVIVTGAASGMGAATVALLADAGAEIHALDVAPITGPASTTYEVDLGDTTSIDATLDAISTATGGKIDGLFNVAGVPQTRPALQVMQVNMLGLRHFTERALDTGLISSGGAIANVASIAGSGWQAHLAEIDELLATSDFEAGTAWCEQKLADLGDPYFFSKECLVVYTMRRSRESFQAGVRMNCISPGPVESAMMPEFREAMGSQTLEWTAEQVGGRMGRPDEMAGPLVFLNSDEASYVNGHNLIVDAGFTSAMTLGLVDFSTLTG